MQRTRAGILLRYLTMKGVMRLDNTSVGPVAARYGRREWGERKRERRGGGRMRDIENGGEDERGENGKREIGR